MTPIQIEVGDKLLKLMLENGGSSSLDQYPVILREQGYDYYKLIGPAVEALKTFGFIESINDHYISLKPEGYEAAKTGLAAYHKQKAYAAEIDLKSKETAIKTARWSLGVSILAIVVATLAFLNEAKLLPIDIAVNSDADSTKGDKQGNSREGNGDDRDPEELISPEHISELKNTLAHDSVFIKELAKALETAKVVPGSETLKDTKPK